MTNVVSIVEGHGEVAALPELLRRLSAKYSPTINTNILKPIRVARDKFLNKEIEFGRHLKLAASNCGGGGWILILLDADDDCPVTKSAKILADAQKVIPHVRISVVMATKEYEAWFIAAAGSLHGKRGFNFNGTYPPNSDAIRDAKGWMSSNIVGKNYGEVLDQPAFTAIMDLDAAKNRSRSFKKLCDEWEKHTPKTEPILNSGEPPQE